MGYDIEILNRIIEERLERQRQKKLEELPKAVPGARTDLTSHHGDERLRSKATESMTNYRLRAIKRAPLIVGYLYENNLLGEIEASKLGLLKPSLEQSQQINEIVAELKE